MVASAGRPGGPVGLRRRARPHALRHAWSPAPEGTGGGGARRRYPRSRCRCRTRMAVLTGADLPIGEAPGASSSSPSPCRRRSRRACRLRMRSRSPLSSGSMPRPGLGHCLGAHHRHHPDADHHHAGPGDHLPRPSCRRRGRRPAGALERDRRLRPRCHARRAIPMRRPTPPYLPIRPTPPTWRPCPGSPGAGRSAATTGYRLWPSRELVAGGGFENGSGLAVDPLDQDAAASPEGPGGPVMVLAPQAAAPLRSRGRRRRRPVVTVPPPASPTLARRSTRRRAALAGLDADRAQVARELAEAEAAEAAARDTLARAAVAWYIGDVQPLDLSAELLDEGARTVRARKEVSAEAALDRRLAVLDDARERAAAHAKPDGTSCDGRVPGVRDRAGPAGRGRWPRPRSTWRQPGPSWPTARRRLDRLLLRIDPAVEGLRGADTVGVTFPIAGPFEFLDSWGFPRSGGRRHRGSDVFSPMGTPLVAIEGGVARADADALGGLVVYLTGDSGSVYYYAHLQAIDPAVSAAGAGAGASEPASAWAWSATPETPSAAPPTCTSRWRRRAATGTTPTPCWPAWPARSPPCGPGRWPPARELGAVPPPVTGRPELDRLPVPGEDGRHVHRHRRGAGIVRSASEVSATASGPHRARRRPPRRLDRRERLLPDRWWPRATAGGRRTPRPRRSSARTSVELQPGDAGEPRAPAPPRRTVSAATWCRATSTPSARWSHRPPTSS